MPPAHVVATRSPLPSLSTTRSRRWLGYPVDARAAAASRRWPALLEDRTEVIALMEKTDDGQWQVFATFRAPVRCKLLDPSSRNKCKLLRYDD